MACNSSEPVNDLLAAEDNELDSPKISALIEQLNRDLKETQTNASKRQ